MDNENIGASKLSDIVLDLPFNKIDFPIDIRYIENKFLHLFDKKFILSSVNYDGSNLIVNCYYIIKPSNRIISLSIETRSTLRNTSISNLIESINKNCFIFACSLKVSIDGYNNAIYFSVEKNKGINDCQINDHGVYINNDYFNFFFKKTFFNVSVEQAKEIGKTNSKSYIQEIVPKITVRENGDIFFGDMSNKKHLYRSYVQELPLPIIVDLNYKGMVYDMSNSKYNVAVAAQPALASFLQNSFIANNSWKIDLFNCKELLLKALQEFKIINSEIDKILF